MLKPIAAVVIGLGLLGGLFVTFDLPKEEVVSSIKKEEPVQSVPMPAHPSLDSSQSFKLFQSDKTLTLESANTVVLRGPVTNKSVADLQIQIEDLRSKLADSEVIYLVMDTPGGSVIAGMDLIDYLKALPNKVQTITLFAASMGFQIVQNMDSRFITESGTLMSHRASGGLEGQFDGELESQYKMIKRKIDYMDAVASKRLGMDMSTYKALIKDEYWVSGFDSVDQKAADQKVNLRCGKSLTGTKTIEFNTFFGSVDVEFSNCPLIRGPLKIKVNRVQPANQKSALKLIDLALIHQRQFVKDVVIKNETDKYFK